jgi:hypothetical protein
VPRRAHSTLAGERRAVLMLAALCWTLSALALADRAAGATACGKRVVADWADNGRIDRFYPLRCYHEAIDILPTDLRDYSNAGDVIRRALSAAVRNGSTATDTRKRDLGTGARADPVTEPARIPISLLLAGGAGLTVLAAGGLGYLSRRRVRSRLGDGGEDGQQIP